MSKVKKPDEIIEHSEKEIITKKQSELHQGTENRSPDLRTILTHTMQLFNTINARNTTLTKVKRNC